MSGVSPFHDPEVPDAMLGRWFQAEDRLYPVVMVSPERYESAVRVVGRLAEHLRAECPDIASLVAADGQAADLVGRFASKDPAAEGDVDLGLIAGAGFSIRYRELAANRGGSAAVPPPDVAVHTPEALAGLITELQSSGLRVETPMESRHGGAGPSDSGMLWVEGVAVTVPTDAAFAKTSPFVLRAEDEGFGIYRDGVRQASATGTTRPRYYDLTTDDGIPYWKIALLHLDSLASTVLQTCAYWGNDDQCQFCGIGLSLDAGRTVAKKRPEQLAEVAVAAKELDGAVDATLTTGSTAGADKGALYVAACGAAVKAAGLPVEVQFEPPDDLDVVNRVHDFGVDSVGIHVESFDPVVLARVAPAKARTGIDGYFAAWERAVSLFGEGQVSTYVILGMGEDPQLTVDGCRRAIDMGVYPFVVPLRPIAGSLMGDLPPPTATYTETIYRQVVPYLAARGLGAKGVTAGCARCQACSAMGTLERVVALSPTRRVTS